jgi:competence protein ComGC
MSASIDDLEKSINESGYEIDRERIKKALDELVRDGFVKKDIEGEDE